MTLRLATALHTRQPIDILNSLFECSIFVYGHESSASCLPNDGKPQIYHELRENPSSILLFRYYMLNELILNLLEFYYRNRLLQSHFILDLLNIVFLNFIPALSKVIPSAELLFRYLNVLIFSFLLELSDLLNIRILNQIP